MFSNHGSKTGFEKLSRFPKLDHPARSERLLRTAERRQIRMIVLDAHYIASRSCGFDLRTETAIDLYAGVPLEGS